MGRDTVRGLAAELYRETGATRRRERHDTTGARPVTRPRHGQLGLRHGWP